MDNIIVSCFLVLFMIQHIAPAFAEDKSDITIFITPSVSDKCPGKPCIRLSQLNGEPDYFVSDTTLVFMRGNHYLTDSISFKNLTNVSMIPYLQSRVKIVCQRNTAWVSVQSSVLSANEEPAFHRVWK